MIDPAGRKLGRPDDPGEVAESRGRRGRAQAVAVDAGAPAPPELEHSASDRLRTDVVQVVLPPCVLIDHREVSIRAAGGPRCVGNPNFRTLDRARPPRLVAMETEYGISGLRVVGRMPVIVSGICQTRTQMRNPPKPEHASHHPIRILRNLWRGRKPPIERAGGRIRPPTAGRPRSDTEPAEATAYEA